MLIEEEGKFGSKINIIMMKYMYMQNVKISDRVSIIIRKLLKDTEGTPGFWLFLLCLGSR